MYVYILSVKILINVKVFSESVLLNVKCMQNPLFRLKWNTFYFANWSKEYIVYIIFIKDPNIFLVTFLTRFISFSALQVELENWVNSIHSACAAAFARHRGKTGTLHLLQEEIFRLEKAIESVSKYSILFPYSY